MFPETTMTVGRAPGVGVRGVQAAHARHLDISTTGYLRRVRLGRADRGR
ncbi:hypothetical protein [Nonomuraea sp. NPDC050783]